MHIKHHTALFCSYLLLALSAAPAVAQPGLEQAEAAPIVEAREALRRKDKPRLLALRDSTAARGHPLALWVDFWELQQRLPEALPEEVDAFLARHAGTYVEDRLRNDWLLELGRRKDFARIAEHYPRFRMNDDREVSCYAQLADHLAGRGKREAARSAWHAQRDVDAGCSQLGAAMAESGQLEPPELWLRARQALDTDRLRLARQAASWAVGTEPAAARELAEALDNPSRWLRRAAASGQAGRHHAELSLLALLRLAGSDTDSLPALLEDRWGESLRGERAAWAWATLARRSALKQSPDAWWHARRAQAQQPKGQTPAWGDETLAWHARSALRLAPEAERWPGVLRAVAWMSPAAQADPAWVYWRARALTATAAQGDAGAPQRAQAQDLLRGISGMLGFYPLLAAETLGGTAEAPATPPPPTPAEQAAARQHPGLARGLKLIEIGLRSEGVREFNYSLRELDDRALLAAAQWACERQVWDRCISASERTRDAISLALRYPTPHRELVTDSAQQAGLEVALVYGLVRQESRFVEDARSGAGAAGLMQLMPATARWTAAKLGLPYTGGQITDRPTNLRLGMHYLRLLLDDFGGAQALAAAAYNAGPNRPRRWREGPVLETAAWVENIPFHETRDYVKKVLANASVYGHLLRGHGAAVQLAPRLGRQVGPRDSALPTANNELP